MNDAPFQRGDLVRLRRALTITFGSHRDREKRCKKLTAGHLGTVVSCKEFVYVSPDRTWDVTVKWDGMPKAVAASTTSIEKLSLVERIALVTQRQRKRSDNSANDEDPR